MSVKIGEISCGYSLRDHEGIFSGSHALLSFSEVSCLVIPEMVILRGLMPGLGSFPTLGGSESVTFVKTEENCSAKNFRFRLSVAKFCTFDHEVSFLPQLFHIGPETLWIFFNSFTNKI